MKHGDRLCIPRRLLMTYMDSTNSVYVSEGVSLQYEIQGWVYVYSAAQPWLSVVLEEYAISSNMCLHHQLSPGISLVASPTGEMQYLTSLQGSNIKLGGLTEHMFHLFAIR